MEKKNGKVKIEEKSSCCGSGMCGQGMMMHTHCHRHKGGFFRFLFSVLVVLFVVGAVMHGCAWGRFHMGNGGYGMMFGKGSEEIFGTINKIDKNNVSILDNAGMTETFQTTAETMIFKATGPIGLSALKVGDNVMIASKGLKEKFEHSEKTTDDAEPSKEVTTMTAKVIRVVEPIILVAPTATTTLKK